MNQNYVFEESEFQWNRYLTRSITKYMTFSQDALEAKSHFTFFLFLLKRTIFCPDLTNESDSRFWRRGDKIWSWLMSRENHHLPPFFMKLHFRLKWTSAVWPDEAKLIKLGNFFPVLKKIEVTVWQNFGQLLAIFWINFGNILDNFWQNYGHIWLNFWQLFAKFEATIG